MNMGLDIPGVRKVLWLSRTKFHSIRRYIFIRRPVVDGQALFENAIINNQPFAVGKMGSVEALSVITFLNRQKAHEMGLKTPLYNPNLSTKLYANAGVFPQNENVYDQFCHIYLEAIKNCDAIASWDIAGEAEIFPVYSPKATLIKLLSIEPYFSVVPWSRTLKGKRVLVISPFTDSIKKQYAKREELWDNPEMLPSFELLTLRAPLSPALIPNREASDWLEALDQLKSQMDAILYDVALIGAGAFSLPLAVYAKNNGKIGIHMGGALQILFGVIGNRWRNDVFFKKLIKESWCSPNKEETPNNAKIVENGCYW